MRPSAPVAQRRRIDAVLGGIVTMDVAVDMECERDDVRWLYRQRHVYSSSRVTVAYRV